MSEPEDRQDATPAVVAPAISPARVPADSADFDAVAAVEGTADAAPDRPAVAEPPRDGRADTVAVATYAGYGPAAPAHSASPVHDDAPLLDDVLEAGIASVFAALHAAAGDDATDAPGESDGPLGDAEAVDGITFRLLGELDRLWHRAA